MRSTSFQHHLVEYKDNQLYYFYLDQNKQIVFNVYKADNTLALKNELVATNIASFSVDIDTHYKIHLICITLEGELRYYICQNQRWDYRVISKLDIRSNHYRYLSIIVKGGYNHVLCTKTNLLNAMVSSIEHMYWDDQSINKLTMTTYLHGKYPSPYQVVVDIRDNLYILYKVSHKNNDQLYFSKFNILHKKWTAGELISHSQEDYSHPHMLIDRNQTLHIVWCSLEENNFVIKYKRKPQVSRSKSKWSKVYSLTNENANHLSPLIMENEDKLMIFSRQSQHISEIYSKDFGDTWTTVEKSALYKMENPILMKYCPLHAPHSNYTLNSIYGEIRDQLTIIGIRTKVSAPTDVFKKKIPAEGAKLSKSPENEDIQTSKVHRDHFSTQTTETVSEMTKEAPSDNHDSPLSSKPMTESITAPVQEQYTKIDESLKALITEVQDYMNQIVIETNKLNQLKDVTNNELSEVTSQDYSSLPINSLVHQLKIVGNQLKELEQEKFLLQREVETCQKKLCLIEDKFIELKKNFLTLQEEISNHSYQDPSLLNWIKALFK